MCESGAGKCRELQQMFSILSERAVRREGWRLEWRRAKAWDSHVEEARKHIPGTKECPAKMGSHGYMPPV